MFGRAPGVPFLWRYVARASELIQVAELFLAKHYWYVESYNLRVVIPFIISENKTRMLHSLDSRLSPMLNRQNIRNHADKLLFFVDIQN